MSMVTAIWLCRMICIVTRGWTSSSTSREAQLRLVEWTGMTGTPAAAARSLNRPKKLQGVDGRAVR